MENLKVKFELNGLKFEIEGSEQVVRDEFKEFKEFTQQLATRINLLDTQLPPKAIKQNDSLLGVSDSEVINDFPLLKDVVMQDLPKTEVEWVLIYAFYASDFGTEAFTRDSIQVKFKESGRFTDNRNKKIAENFKSLVSKRYIKSKNETEYLFLEEGKNKAMTIINNDKKATVNQKKRVTTKSESKEKVVANKSTSNPQILKDLNFRPDGKIALKEFAAQYEIENSEETYLIMVYYLKEVLEESKITLSHIFSGLIELDKKIPSHLKQTLINFRNNSNQWLELSDLDNINYSIRGMNHIKHDIKKAKPNA